RSNAAKPPAQLPDEDGYKLWLRYAPPGGAAKNYRHVVQQIRVDGTSATSGIIRDELRSATGAMLGGAMPLNGNGLGDGTVLVGTPGNSTRIRDLNWAADLGAVGDEGFIIRSARLGKRPVTVIAANTEIGALYGSFHFLRLMQTGRPIDRLRLTERPALQLRLMNHWDNPNGTIERGYAGRSIWQWNELPGKLSPHYADYARACASLGINGAVINNVNADPRMLSPEWLRKVAALADVWRPYGVRTYLCANFATPVRLGGLPTADPLDNSVADWWKTKADEVYGLIPDFGGFLVKADSEGQPGPKTYGRTHADGANVLADALAPHKGNVIWRAFVYDNDIDPDRAKRAYLEFTRLDGQFRPNVAVQVKNGPVDFQPREPFHPLFGAMKHTPVIAEIQATQEYLGQAKHLVYLGTMWKEFLDSDTFAKGSGSTVAKVLAGKVQPSHLTGMVSVTNPGLDTNWCGHHFSQSNWYAFGRLAWNPELAGENLADEWTRMTFTNDDTTVAVIRDLMMSSRETYVNYTMPLGLHHLIGGDHYAPQPWNDRAPRPDWTATYYHHASADGIGFERTKRGDHAVEQYFPPVCDRFDDITKCPEKYLLWFHRCAWDYQMKSGRTLWDELCAKYQRGAEQAAAVQKTWQSLAGKIDSRRHKDVADRLAIQVADAAKWRDQILEYFGRFSQRPVPRSR
ncbi:MAG TPA: alpha-glucuronidase family glycosyl hydrolase, partial [Candidatus Acidoferrum sp.]|nr:alpha-glucuronidase family glycosyl hydrolase [Candidatus Acidoferrum sp.]